ncbi:hypothetical protein D9M73_137220 [compost metagenome]
MFANLSHVGFIGCHFRCTIWIEQCPDFLVQISGQRLKLLLPQAGFRFQALPFSRLRQAIAAAAEQFRRTTEDTAVVENLPQGRVGFVHSAVFQLAGTQVTLFHLVLGQKQLLAITGLFEQEQGCAGAQICLIEPLPALCCTQGQPVFNLFLFDRQALSQYFEHRLVAIAERVKAVTQAKCFTRVVQHAGIRQPAALQHFQQPIGHDVVQSHQFCVVGAATQ